MEVSSEMGMPNSRSRTSTSSSTLVRAVLLASVAAALVACRTRTSKIADDSFPSDVAPPFGLDRLDGGMPSARAQEILSSLRDPSSDPSTEGVKVASQPDGVTIDVRIDHDRVADIGLSFENCQSIRPLLIRRWGAPVHTDTPMTTIDLWSGKNTSWSASLATRQRGCALTFTSAHYFGDHVLPIQELIGVKVGMTAEEASRVVPTIAKAKWTLPIAGLVDGQMGVVFAPRSGRVTSSFIVIPLAAALAMKRAWGNGAQIRQPDARTIWVDSSTRYRAVAPQSVSGTLVRVDFDQYEPLATWLGDGDAIGALNGNVLGAPLEQVRERYRDHVADVSMAGADLVLSLPPTEWSFDSGTDVELSADAGGNVNSISVRFAYDMPATRAAMLALFERKWGRAEVSKSGWEMSERTHVTAGVEDLGDALKLRLMVK